MTKGLTSRRLKRTGETTKGEDFSAIGRCAGNDVENLCLVFLFLTIRKIQKKCVFLFLAVTGGTNNKHHYGQKCKDCWVVLLIGIIYITTIYPEGLHMTSASGTRYLVYNKRKSGPTARFTLCLLVGLVPWDSLAHFAVCVFVVALADAVAKPVEY